MNALVATAPVLSEPTSDRRSTAGLFARGLARLAAFVGAPVAAPQHADELWFLRVSGTAVEPVPSAAPSNSPVTPSTSARPASAAPASSARRVPARIAQGSRFRHSAPAPAARKPGSM